jgi:GTPase SAR1 family protein
MNKILKKVVILGDSGVGKSFLELKINRKNMSHEPIRKKLIFKKQKGE